MYSYVWTWKGNSLTYGWNYHIIVLIIKALPLKMPEFLVKMKIINRIEDIKKSHFVTLRTTIYFNKLYYPKSKLRGTFFFEMVYINLRSTPINQKHWI